MINIKSQNKRLFCGRFECSIVFLELLGLRNLVFVTDRDFH